MKKSYYILLPVILIFFFSLFKSTSSKEQDAQNQYKEAVQFANTGQHDFAFLEFRTLIRDFPESKYAHEAMFAIGEYFYSQDAYYEAIKYFARYINANPEAKGAIFAKAYLLYMMESIEDPLDEEKEIIDKIKLEFFSKPLFLLFSEYKESSYKSAFQNEFKIRYYLDKIEVYKNEDLLITVTP